MATTPESGMGVWERLTALVCIVGLVITLATLWGAIPSDIGARLATTAMILVAGCGVIAIYRM